MTDITPQLRQLFGERLKEREPMAKHTNFRIGGPARWFVEARDEQELGATLDIASKAHVRLVVHGGGSNVLYADAGVDALVVVPALRDVQIEGGRVTAGAGVLSVFLARKVAEAGLAGLEWMISLPGTIGGAVRGNAGCFGGETKDRLVSARIGKIEDRGWRMEEFTVAELEMSYRHSILKTERGEQLIVLSATFDLEPGDPSALKAQLEKNLAARKASQPMNAGSAGCLFKNVVVSDDDLARLSARFSIPEPMRASKRLGAGWLIDRLDLKGTRVGGASVSDVHGNFIINDGTATADDVLQLAALLKSRVRNAAGIQLEEEIEYIS